MDDEARVSINPNSIRSSPATVEVRPSYWLDACEDISCDIIGDLVDFGEASVLPEALGDQLGNGGNQEEDGLVNDFFGGIDHILDSIKNGDGLPSLSDFGVGGDRPEATGLDGGVLQNATPKVEFLAMESNGGVKLESGGDFGQGKNLGNGNGNGELSLVPSCEDNSNGRRRHENYLATEVAKERCVDGDERCSKRPRLGVGKNERYGGSRGQYLPRERERERFSNRKRQRDWDEIDRKDRDHVRRRENYGNNRRENRDRDLRDREPKGYWERDKSGTNELVFRSGSYEADRKREAKAAANGGNQESNVKEDNKSEEAKEKIPEEHARQYQLDVLEQAKKKNTIAFLETGAGKTLIAVLLIKSLSSDLQKQNKKLLAVFLVPKVPLVYQ
ncbi:hypothetical protein UlMin_021841, partial [Ulmus minor]